MEVRPAVIDTDKNLGDLLRSWKAKLVQIYGGTDEDAGRLLAMAEACVRRNPDLKQCTVDSFRTALEDAAALKLLPTGLMNLGHVLSFRNKQGSRDATFVAGYRGLLDICYRSKKLAGFEVGLVHRDDPFTYRRGLQTILDHEPKYSGVIGYENRQELVAGYAVWWDVIDGHAVAQRHLVLNQAEIERLRMKSKKADDGPWRTDYSAMVMKTIVRAATKLMPLTPAEDALLARAFEVEDAKLGQPDPFIDVTPGAPTSPPDGRLPIGAKEDNATS
jgi:recombination protein RecT